MTDPKPDRLDPVIESQKLRRQLYAAVDQLEQFSAELREFVRTAHDDEPGETSE